MAGLEECGGRAAPVPLPRTLPPHTPAPSTTHTRHTAGKTRKCVRMTGQKAIRDVVRALYSEERMDSCSGSLTLSEYCARHSLAPTFDPQYRPFLHCNLMESGFDIYFGYDILTKICEPLYQTLSEECRADIRKLCELVTEEVATEQDAAPALHALRLTLGAVYRGVSQVFHEEFIDNLKDTELMIDEILSTDDQSEEEDTSSPSEVGKYRKLRMTVKGHQELKEHYQRLRDLNPFTWEERERYRNGEQHGVTNFQVENIYTQPDILRSKEGVHLRHLLTSAEERGEGCGAPPVLLLHGLAGSGKTSLCRYLIHSWLKGGREVEGLGRYALVLLIEMRRVRSSRLKEFLLDELLPMTCSGLDQDHIISALKELDVLFLIDGYDEVTRVSSDLVEDVFAKFGDKQILVTTRPELHRDVVCLARRHNREYVSLEMRGFDDERREDFSGKLVSFMSGDDLLRQKQWKAFMEYSYSQCDNLDEYFNLPVTAALLVFLWTHDSEILTTPTRLYKEIYELLRRRLAERLSKNFIGVSDLPAILESLVLCLGEQAWAMLREGSVVASDMTCEKLEQKCKEKGIKVIDFLSGFHLCNLDEDPDAWKLKVAFQSPASARYLAATFLADCLHKKVMKVQELGGQVDACPGLEQLLMFLIGQLAAKNSLTPTIVNELFNIMKKVDVNPTNFNFWWNIFVESQNHPQVGTILAEEKLPQKHWHLDQSTVTVALRLLSQTPIRIRSLTIDISNSIEPHEVLNFLQSLEGVGQHLKKRQRRLIKTELHLWHHEAPGHDNTSEHFLKALCPWSDLTSFTGGMGEQVAGEELLTGFSNLRTIRVRVSSLEAFKSLSNSLRKIHRSVKSLHVTLTLPRDCSPKNLSDLRHNGALEIRLLGTSDEQKEWLVGVVKVVGGRGGCWRLNLAESRLTYGALEWVVRELKGHIRHKIDIESVGD